MTVRLRRLKIHHFREVAAGTELRFHDGMNVLLGLNASGKTTLLELVAAILRGDLSKLGRFHVEFDLESEGARLEVECGFESGMIGDEVVWRELANGTLCARGFEPDGRRVGEVKLADEEHLRWRVAWGDRSGESPAPDNLWASLVERVTASIWEFENIEPRFSTPGCQRVDESLICFDELHGGASDRAASLRAVWRNGDPVSLDARNVVTDLVERAAAHLLQASPQPPVVTVDQGESPFLADVARKLDFAGCQWRATPRTQQRVGPRTIAEYAQFSFAFTREDGAFVDDAILSYGQKRMLALLYQMRAHDGPFVADELVNGLHHAWIDLLLEELGPRQSFVSTQSPLLLDYLSFESAEEVRRTFVFCTRRREGAEGATALVWQGLSDEDARAFFEAYQVGIQHVSELLRTRGLW